MSYKRWQTHSYDISINGFPSSRSTTIKTAAYEVGKNNTSKPVNAAHQAFASGLRKSTSNATDIPTNSYKGLTNLQSPSMMECVEHNHITIKQNITILKDLPQLKSPALIKNITHPNAFDTNIKNKKISAQRNFVYLQGKSFDNCKKIMHSTNNDDDILQFNLIQKTSEIPSSILMKSVWKLPKDKSPTPSQNHSKTIKPIKPMKLKSNKYKIKAYENAITIPQNKIVKPIKQTVSKESEFNKSPTLTPTEVIEEPIIKKHFYILGPTHHSTLTKQIDKKYNQTM